MKKAINIYTIVCLFCISAIAQTVPADLEVDLQQIVINALPSKFNNPGLVLGVHVPGQWSWYGSAGQSITGLTASYPTKNALSSDKFRVGSISKMFVSTKLPTTYFFAQSCEHIVTLAPTSTVNM